MRIQTPDTSIALQDFKQSEIAVKMEDQHNGVHYGTCSCCTFISVHQLVDRLAKRIHAIPVAHTLSTLVNTEDADMGGGQITFKSAGPENLKCTSWSLHL